MGFVEFFQFGAFQKRRIAAQNHGSSLFALQQVPCLEYGMAGSQLFLLDGDAGAGSQKFRHFFRSESDNDDFIIDAGFIRRIQHMLQHRLAGKLMKYLREPGFHPRSLACCQDNCSKF